jgi:MFS transporter, FSR family, fosmidomycin resistance protein
MEGGSTPTLDPAAGPAGSREDATVSAARDPGRGPFGGALAATAVMVAFAHALNDAYAAFLHPLLPRIMERLGLSIALAATLAMTLSLAASLLQPVMGYAADRWGRRYFVVLGPLASGVFLSLIGVAPSFTVLLVLLALGGLGSAAFHPPGAAFAARVGDGRGSGARLSIFSFGGAVGYAIGPMAAVGIVAWRGLEGLWIAMLPVLLLTPLLWRSLPPPRTERSAVPPPRPAELLAALRGPLGVVFGISATAAFVQRVFLTMTPIAVHDAGGSEAAGALALSIYLGAQAAGTLTGGFLADRRDRRRLLLGLSLAAVPAHLLAMAAPHASVLAVVGALVAGFANMALLPPVIVIAQEIMPRGTAVGSGIVMGLAWATGSIFVLGVGVLGDMFGARDAALMVMPLGLIAAGLALHPALAAHRRAAG